MNNRISTLQKNLHQDVAEIIKKNADKIQAMAYAELDIYFIRQFIYQKLCWKYKSYIIGFENAYFENEYSTILQIKKAEIEKLEHFSSEEKLCFYTKAKERVKAGTEEYFHVLAVKAIREIVNSELLSVAVE